MTQQVCHGHVSASLPPLPCSNYNKALDSFIIDAPECCSVLDAAQTAVFAQLYRLAKGMYETNIHELAARGEVKWLTSRPGGGFDELTIPRLEHRCDGSPATAFVNYILKHVGMDVKLSEPNKAPRVVALYLDFMKVLGVQETKCLIAVGQPSVPVLAFKGAYQLYQGHLGGSKAAPRACALKVLKAARVECLAGGKYRALSKKAIADLQAANAGPCAPKERCPFCKRPEDAMDLCLDSFGEFAFDPAPKSWERLECSFANRKRMSPEQLEALLCSMAGAMAALRKRLKASNGGGGGDESGGRGESSGGDESGSTAGPSKRRRAE